jgi:probable rRNA maturation factor
MCYHIDIQIACEHPLGFPAEEAMYWAKIALKDHISEGELTLRFVEEEEIHSYNHQYRNQDKPTNVLAFPSEIPKDILLQYPFLGDIIVCPEVLKKESLARNIPLHSHAAHIIIHGVLHLLGYDHEEEEEEIIMQAKEVSLLKACQFANPYQNNEETS